jgi:hypothetical protein
MATALTSDKSCLQDTKAFESQGTQNVLPWPDRKLNFEVQEIEFK